MSLPAALPARVVRRVVCDHCEELFDAVELFEVRARPELPRISMPSFARVDPRWVTLPLAALAVFAILSLVTGGDEPISETSPSAPVAAAEPASATPGADAKSKTNGKKNKPAPVTGDAQLVSESTFSVALPAGWDRVNPSAGATFAAVSPDGAADATLWIRSDPKLDLATFEQNSLAQLETLAGSAEVVERKIGPSVESSSLVLAPKDAPEDAPIYEVVLRGAGENWYYLATTYQANASAEAVAAVDLIQGSFVPHGGKR